MNAPRNVEALVVMQPIAVDTASPDREGMLVMANGMLVAILVQLDAPEHEHQVSHWFVEAVFGRLLGLRAPPFATLDEATRWFRHRLNRERVAS